MKLLRMAATVERDPVRASAAPEREEESPWAIYRNHTVVLLRKYFRMSLEVGRMPSLLGGELFRARVTAYRVQSFEDTVIFVHDMERCLEKLDALSRLLIGKIVLQEFLHDEVAGELRITRRQVIRRVSEALDRASEILLKSRMLEPLRAEDGLPIKKGPQRATALEWLRQQGYDC